MSALELRPDDGETLIALVQVLRNRPDEALPFARRAVAAPASPRRRAVAHRLLAELQDDLGDTEQAEASLARALTLAGNDLDSLRAVVRLKRGRSDAARAHARRALQAAGDAPVWCRGAAYRFVALIFLDIDDRAGARKSLSRALELDPDDIKALETMLQIHKRAPDLPPEDSDSARGESRASSGTIIPDELEALRAGFERSLAAQRRAEAADFAERFSASAAKAPTWQRFDAYRLSVEMWLELGDDAKARVALDRLEDRDHQALAALRLWHRVYPESPRGPGEGVWVDTIVQLRHQLSDDTGAEAALERALARFPDDRGVLQVMTDFKLSQRKPEEALVYGKRLLAAYEKASPSDMLTIFRDHTYFAGMKISEKEKLQYALQNAEIVAQARREREEGLRAARETVAKIEAALKR